MIMSRAGVAAYTLIIVGGIAVMGAVFFALAPVPGPGGEGTANCGRVFGAAPLDTSGFCSRQRSRTAAIIWPMLAAGVPVLATGLWLLLISIRQQRSALLLRMRQQQRAEAPHKPLP